MPTIDVDGCVCDAHGRLWRPPYSKWPHERPQHRWIESQFNLKRLTFYLRCKFVGHNWTSCNNPLPIPWFLCYACTVPWYFFFWFWLWSCVVYKISICKHLFWNLYTWLPWRRCFYYICHYFRLMILSLFMIVCNHVFNVFLQDHY